MTNVACDGILLELNLLRLQHSSKYRLKFLDFKISIIVNFIEHLLNMGTPRLCSFVVNVTMNPLLKIRWLLRKRKLMVNIKKGLL